MNIWAKIVLKVLKAEAVFILRKDGVWEYIGIPPIPYIRENWFDEPDNEKFEDIDNKNRKEAWWVEE